MKLQKKDGEYQSARREALGFEADAKRLQEQLQDYQHKNNLYKVEVERLIKEIDMADAKTRQAQEDLMVARAEADRELQNVQHRILYSRGKQEERSLVDLKREHSLAIEQIKQTAAEQLEEIDYLKEKVIKLETKNKELYMMKDSKDEMKTLENKVELLQAQVDKYENQNRDVRSAGDGSIRANLSAQEQVTLQKQLNQYARMIDTLNADNESL